MREKDSPARSATKALTWRVVATLTTICIVYIFTGKLALSLGVGGVEVLAKMLFYYLHERAWTRIAFGKAKISGDAEEGP